MKTKTVPSKWMMREGLRLDVGPYLSGALEARVRLEELTARKERLENVTTGYNGGIYNGPQFSRKWVTDPRYGVPFVGSSSMQMADLSHLPLLQKKYAKSTKLAYLELKPGMTLISCLGTIGRMVYVRPDMEGIWSSQDIMKVVPDPDKIPPGYLYAYLSSKFGVPLVISGTYGAIIQHIEPHHIADLPVPRLGEALEQEVHELVEEAARARTKARELFREADEKLHQLLNIPLATQATKDSSPPIAHVAASLLQSRADAYYYSPANTEARSAWNKPASRRELQEVASVFIPGIFKRRYADDPAHGFPYITGADVFQLAPTSDRYLMKSVANQYQLIIRNGMILVQETGQLGGLIGRSILAGEYLDGFACTNNMVRVTPNDVSDAGYLYTLLSSEHGVRLISRESAGSSIPHIEVGRVRRIQVPWPNSAVRTSIGSPSVTATALRDRACELDVQAREILETAIEEAT